MFFKRKANIESPVIKEAYVLGTVIQLKVYGNKAEKAIDESIIRLNEIDDRMSVFKEFSDISRINKNAGVEAQVVNEDTYYVIEKAFEYAKLSQGAFDPTIRPLVNLWGVWTEHAKVPSKEEIAAELQYVNYKDIILNGTNSSIKLSKEKQCLDVGAIAKGYAADEVKQILKEDAIKSAIIDLGGNIFALGKKFDGSLWNIGIQHPLSSRGKFVGIVSFADKSVVTSGNYERYFIQEGKRYHHIIDPRTGYPSENGIISATIISDYSIDGDGLSTCVYVLGPQKAMKLIEGIRGVDAIVITEDRKVYVTSGIKDNFKITNEEFTEADLFTIGGRAK